MKVHQEDSFHAQIMRVGFLSSLIFIVEIHLALGFSTQGRDCKTSLQFSGFIQDSLQGIMHAVFSTIPLSILF